MDYEVEGLQLDGFSECISEVFLAIGCSCRQLGLVRKDYLAERMTSIACVLHTISSSNRIDLTCAVIIVCLNQTNLVEIILGRVRHYRHSHFSSAGWLFGQNNNNNNYYK